MPKPLPRKSGPVPKYAKSVTELGARLLPPRDRKIIQRAMRLEGCPGKTADGLYEIAAWQEFVAKNFSSRDDEAPDKRALEMEKLRLTNERLQFELDVKRRDYSANKDVEQWVGAMMAEVRKVLTSLPSKLAPLVVRGSEAEAELLMKQEIHAAMNLISSKPWTGAST